MKIATRKEVLREMARNSAERPDELPVEKEAVQRFWGKSTQFQNPKTGQWIKRDKETGQIMEVKDEPYHPVPREH